MSRAVTPDITQARLSAHRAARSPHRPPSRLPAHTAAFVQTAAVGLRVAAKEAASLLHVPDEGSRLRAVAGRITSELRSRLQLTASDAANQGIRVAGGAVGGEYTAASLLLVSRGMTAVQQALDAAADEFPALRPLLTDAAAAVVRGCDDLRGASSDWDRTAALLGAAREEAATSVRLTRAECQDEVHGLRTEVGDLRGRLDTALAAEGELQATLATRDSTVAALRIQVAELRDILREYEVDNEVKRDALAETEDKVNGVIRENRVLRRIADHNRDLLQEANDARLAMARLESAQRTAVTAAERTAQRAEQCRAAAERQVQHVSSAMGRQRDELALLRRVARDARAMAAQLRAERDTSAAERTPRPDVGVAQRAAEKAGAGGPPAEAQERTAALVDRMARRLEDLAGEAQLLRAKSALHARAGALLADDDLEGILRHAAPRSPGPPCLPASSTCVVGPGATSLTVPAHRRWAGTLSLRAVALPEALAIVARGASLAPLAGGSPPLSPLGSIAGPSFPERPLPSGFDVASAAAVHAALPERHASALTSAFAAQLHAALADDAADDPGAVLLAVERTLAAWGHTAQAEAAQLTLAGALPPRLYGEVLGELVEFRRALRDLAPPPPREAKRPKSGRAEAGKEKKEARPAKAAGIKRRVFYDVVADLWPQLQEDDLARVHAAVTAETQRLAGEGRVACARDEVPSAQLFDAADDALLAPVPAALLRAVVAGARRFAARATDSLTAIVAARLWEEERAALMEAAGADRGSGDDGAEADIPGPPEGSAATPPPSTVVSPVELARAVLAAEPRCHPSVVRRIVAALFGDPAAPLCIAFRPALDAEAPPAEEGPDGPVRVRCEDDCAFHPPGGWAAALDLLSASALLPGVSLTSAHAALPLMCDRRLLQAPAPAAAAPV